MESAGAALPGPAHTVPSSSTPQSELELEPELEQEQEHELQEREERAHGNEGGDADADADADFSLSRSRSLDGEELGVEVEDIPPGIVGLHLPAESSKRPGNSSSLAAGPPGPDQDVKENPGKKKKEKEKAPAVPFYKLFAFADGVDYVFMLLGTVGAMGVGASQPALALLLGSILNAFGSSGPSLHHSVNQLVLKLIYVGIASAVAGYTAVAFWAATAERQSNRIRTAYLRAILKQDVAFFDKETATGEVVARLATDTLHIQAAVGDQAGRFVQYMSTFVAGYAIALFKGWKLALVIASSLPLLFGTGALGAALVQMKTRRGLDAYSEGAKMVEQILSSIRTVVCFSGEKKAVDDYDRSLKKGYKVSVSQTVFASVGVSGIFLVLYNTYALGLWYGSILVTNEGYNGGTALTIIFSIILGGLSLGHAAPSLAAIQLGRQASFKLFEVIVRKPPIDSSDPGGESIADLKGDIELRQVHFHYPTRPGVQIFSNFCLSIASCSTVALVGESGSGKSTVVSLIERFYDPQCGVVLLDGVDIKTLNVTWLRQQIGLVGQEPVLFAASIRDNIAYGKPGATTEEIQAAAERANAAFFIGKFPEGYDTQVGEHGAQLSGGQKQRVAIARAILKNPKILLLDEATSALDTKSETVVQEALDRLMKDRTTVVVAHRLSTIRNASMIAVVQHGAIIQQGTHAELLSNESGAYFQLVQLQALKPAEEPEADVDDDEVNLISYASSRSSSRYSSSRRSSSFRSIAGKPVDSNELRARIAQAPKQGLVDRLIRRPKPVYDIETGSLFPHKEHSIFRPLSLLRGDGKLFALVGVVCAIGYGASTPVFGLLLAHAVTIFYNPDPHEVRRHINFWACMFVVLAVSVAIVMPIRTLCLQVMGHKLARVVRRSMFSKVVRQEIGWFDDAENSSGAVSARLAVDGSVVQSIVGDLVSLLVQNLSTVVGALLIGFLANWKLALVVFAMMPLIGLQGYVQIQRTRGSGARTKVAYQEASQMACDAVGSIRTVASFCAEKTVVQTFEAKCKTPKEEEIKQGFIAGAGLGFAQFATFVAYALSFWYGARLVDKGETSFHDVFMVFLAIALSATSIAQSTSLAPDLGRVYSAVDSIFEILDAKSKIDSSNMNGKTLLSVKGDIEYRHVKFRYPSRPDVLIFRNFSLSIPAGKTVALVGESGSGKSTAISLLERFYDPEAGLILLDGIDIKELQLKWLRQQLGLVSQEPVVFNDTIRANILYGRHDNGTGPDVSQEELEGAAKASNAHKFISELPDGYNTMVGEKGTQLSGGQKQRIAIARAIVKNPKVLLLDEATSALDAESERVVQDALDRVAMDRTTIMIAHRLSTVQNADIIAVVKHRTIVEKGRHEELMSKPNGAYARLANLRSSMEKT